MNIPTYWKEFREKHNLIGAEIEIPEKDDRSTIGAEIEIFDDDGIRSEANDLYPGIEALKHGFVPVGGCLIGSGDPYFIQSSEGVEGSLYRIYYDTVFEDDFPEAEAVAIVLERFADLLHFQTDPGAGGNFAALRALPSTFLLK